MRLELVPHHAVQGATTVALAGELDQAGAPQLRQRLDAVIARDARLLLVDLSDATFIDSAMLGVVVYAARRVGPLGGRLAVLCPDAGMRQVFQIVGLDRLFTVTADPAEAVRALSLTPPE